jgi:hypothetical protein
MYACNEDLTIQEGTKLALCQVAKSCFASRTGKAGFSRRRRAGLETEFSSACEK